MNTQLDKQMGEGKTLCEVLAPRGYMKIQWKDKPSHYDTHMITRLWFDKQNVCYIQSYTGMRPEISKANIKTVEAITIE